MAYIHYGLVLGWLLCSYMNMSYACPFGCKCASDQKQYYVACDGMGLTTVPEDIPANTTDLSLGSNQLSVLTSAPLVGLSQLRIIYLRNNVFRRINNETLHLLKGVGEDILAVDLSENPLDCSCHPEVVEFIRWIEDHRGPLPITTRKHWVALVDGYKTLCDTPLQMKGRRLDSLKPSDVCSKSEL